MKKIELLSPAGDLERLKIALIYGADAVYIGGKDYSLRANANNFSLEEIKEACDFAHNLGKKVYLTLNIVFHNEDIDGVYEYIKKVYKAGIDAFIVSDLFIVSYIKKNFPKVEVHLSTQDSTTNYESVLYLKNEGIDRVVLARETNLEEIKEIIDKTHIDIECFIHGAMCTFYSGRCVLSNYFTNRDSNRGGCAQVCRFNFEIEGSDDFSVAVKDLNASYLIKDLIEIGVRSLKVEGRMRSPYYLATVLSSYRRIIDNYYNGTLNEELLEKENKILSRVSNRDNSTHYYKHKADVTDQYYTNRQELSNQDYLALFLEKKDNLYTIKQRNYFKVGDTVEIITPSFKIYQVQIDNLYNEDGAKIELANHADEILKIKLDLDIEPFSMMRRI
ncbi:MAG: U32 family peptidase [Bacilli bacterium]|nr:U32 family peptidase [Bacilli bacterium]